MGRVIQFQRPEPNRLSRDEFKALVVEMASKGHVRFTTHVLRDHPERGISPAMIERCLEKGTVQTDPYRNKYGNFESEIFRHMAGEQLTVVVAIEWEKQLVVVTAF